jgi:hypothetical protein
MKQKKEYLLDIIDKSRKIEITNSNDDIISINTNNIFFIEYNSDDRGMKKIYLISSSTLKIKQEKIEWKTRMSMKKILIFLGKEKFIQVHQKYIVKKINLFGKTYDNKYVFIRSSKNHNQGLTKQNTDWNTREIPLGKSFKNHINKYLSKFSTEIKIKDICGDLIYINPAYITYIKISKEVKTIYLSSPITINNKNIYSIDWKTRKNGEMVMNYLEIRTSLMRLNKYNIVNIQNVYRKPKNENSLFLKSYDEKNNKKLCVEREFKINKSYFKREIEVSQENLINKSKENVSCEISISDFRTEKEFYGLK